MTTLRSHAAALREAAMRVIDTGSAERRALYALEAAERRLGAYACPRDRFERLFFETAKHQLEAARQTYAAAVSESIAAARCVRSLSLINLDELE